MELVLKLGLLCRLVRRDAHYYRVLLCEFARVLTEPLGFRGSTGCVGLGEKVQHHVLALETRQIEWLVPILNRPNRGGCIAFVQEFAHEFILPVAKPWRNPVEDF